MDFPNAFPSDYYLSKTENQSKEKEMNQPYLINIYADIPIPNELVPTALIEMVRQLPDDDPYKPLFVALLDNLATTTGVNIATTHTVGQLLIALEEKGVIKIVNK